MPRRRPGTGRTSVAQDGASDGRSRGLSSGSLQRDLDIRPERLPFLPLGLGELGPGLGIADASQVSVDLQCWRVWTMNGRTWGGPDSNEGKRSRNTQVKSRLTFRFVGASCKCFDATARSGMLHEESVEARPGRVRRTDRRGGARTRIDR